MTLNVEVLRDHPSTSDITGRTIEFKGKRATMLRASKATDALGKAQAVFRGDRNQVAMLSAEFHGAKVEVEAKIAWLGPGEVTKIALLKGTPHDEVPTFFTPL